MRISGQLLGWLAAALSFLAAGGARAEGPYLQFTIEGPGIARQTATFDVTGWSGTKHSAKGASALQGAVSREGRHYSQVTFSISGDTPYLVLGVFEDGMPVEGPGSNSLAMRSKPDDGVQAHLDVTRTLDEPKIASGTFSGELVVTNRKAKSPAERTYRITDGRYSFAATR